MKTTAINKIFPILLRSHGSSHALIRNLLLVWVAILVLPGSSATSKAAGILYGLGYSDDASTLYSIDTATAVVTLGGPYTAASFTDLAFLDRKLYATDVFGSGGFRLVEIDTATGLTTRVSDQAGNTNWHGLAAAPDAGLLYAVSTGDALWSLAPGSGDLVRVGSMGLPASEIQRSIGPITCYMGSSTTAAFIRSIQPRPH